MISINRRRLRNDWTSWTDRLVPDDEDKKTAYIALTKAIAALVVTAKVAVLTPMYIDDYESFKASWWANPIVYLPHLVVLFALDLIPFLFVFGVGWMLVIAQGYNALAKMISKSPIPLDPWSRMSLRQNQHREYDEDTYTPDDKYFLPLGGPAADNDVVEKAPHVGDRPILEKDLSVLAVGETRAGKTSSIKMMASQLDYGPTTAVVAHGSVERGSGEYTDFFRNDLGLQVDTIGSRGADRRWNLFREIPDGASQREAEEKFQEISATLISVQDSNNPHFPRNARQVFTAMCSYLYEHKDDPHHGDLHGLIRSNGAEVGELLADNGYDGAGGKCISSQDDNKGSDVWDTLTGQLMDMFVKDFAEEGTFSFREYIQNPQGRIVSVESPESVRNDAEKRMYSAMLDEALDQMIRTHQHPTYAILDEIDTIGRMTVLGDMASRGLAQDSRLIVGIQTVAQLRSVYGREDTRGIVGNLPQTVALSPGTPDCVEMVEGELGESRYTRETGSTSVGLRGNLTRTSSEQLEEHCPIDSSTMKNWDTGEGVIISRTGWWHGRLVNPDTWIERLWNRRGSVDKSLTGRRSDVERAEAAGS